MHYFGNFVFKIKFSILAVSTEMSIWENVVITPLEKAYSETDMQPYYGDEKIVAGGDNAVISSQPQLA